MSEKQAATAMSGPEFKAIRERLGLTQTELGARLKMHRKTVYHLEKAPVVDPMPALAIRQLEADANAAAA